jgi:hypothetical protein
MNGGVVSAFSRLEIMRPSVRPIERAMRAPRMDPQSQHLDFSFPEVTSISRERKVSALPRLQNVQ